MKKELTVKELHFITWDNQERIEENVRIEMSYDWEKKQPWEKGRPYTVVLHFKDGTDYRASFDRVEECQTMFVGVTDVCNMLTILDTPKEFWDAITYCRHPYSSKSSKCLRKRKKLREERKGSDDLISRKDALDCVNATLYDFGIDFGDKLRSALEGDLENLPTAFDKEKVLDCLKEEGCIIDNESGNRAVEIIKKGGIEK